MEACSVVAHGIRPDEALRRCAALGTAQTLAWASSYYLPAILADAIGAGLGLSRTVVFGIFSGALLMSAFLGPVVGRAIDQRGGRGMLAISNVVLAAGLVLLGTAQGIVTLTIAWALLGVGMAMDLYDPAFATLTGLYGCAARGPITGITLAFVFAATWFVAGAMAAHLPHLLEIVGASTTAAIAAAALVGPAQVGARLVEFGALRKVHPLVSARMAAILHPLGALVLLATGPATIAIFSVFHGAGNGLLTIAKGTLPLAIFGPIGYGHRSGVLGACGADSIAPDLRRLD